MRLYLAVLALLCACASDGDKQRLSSHSCETPDYYDPKTWNSFVPVEDPPNAALTLPGTSNLVFRSWSSGGPSIGPGSSAEITGPGSYTGIKLDEALAVSTKVESSYMLAVCQEITGDYALKIGDAPLGQVSDLFDLHLAKLPQSGRPDARVYARTNGDFRLLQVAGYFDGAEIGGTELLLSWLCSVPYPLTAWSYLCPHLASGKARPSIRDWHGYEFEVIGPFDRVVHNIRVGEGDLTSPSRPYYESADKGLDYLTTLSFTVEVHLFEIDPVTGPKPLADNVVNLGPLGTPIQPNSPVDVPITATLTAGKRYAVLFRIGGLMAGDEVRGRFTIVDPIYYPYPSGDGLYEITRSLQLDDLADLAAELAKAPATDATLAPWMRIDSDKP